MGLNASLNLMLMTWEQNLFGQSTTIRTFATLQSALLTIIVAIGYNTMNIFFKNKKKRRKKEGKKLTRWLLTEDLEVLHLWFKDYKYIELAGISI
jgi:hypothetical protein